MENVRGCLVGLVREKQGMSYAYIVRMGSMETCRKKLPEEHG